MEIKKCIKESFSVIGKEGSTNDGENFIAKLWNDANSHFSEVEHLAKKDSNKNLVGIWGLMSDFSRSFKPWEENFTKGLYLAGVEVIDDAVPPANWVKWTIPSYEYLYTKVEKDMMETISYVLDYINKNNLNLIGAIQDYTCPCENGQPYVFFPIKKIN